MMDMSSDELIAEQEFLDMQLRYNQRMQQQDIELPTYIVTFQPRATMYLCSLNDFTIVNLHEFKHIQFYHKKKDGNDIIYLLNKCNTKYFVADNYKLYTLEDNKLIQGVFSGKLQCWALPKYN